MTPYAVLGDPIEHSLSPRIHNAAFRALGLGAHYTAIRCTADEVPQLMRSLAGGSVTIPHKGVAAAACDRLSDVVVRTGACNTFVTRPDGLHGENTDVAGFLEAAAHHGVALAGQDVLVLGAGGAASAVLEALTVAGAARITLVNRSRVRADALAARYPAVAVADAPVPAAIIVNATSVGLSAGDPHPIDVDTIHADAVILDVVYRSGFVTAARARGFAAFDGTEMLLRQAAAAFALWTGREAPLDVMREALAAS